MAMLQLEDFNRLFEAMAATGEVEATQESRFLGLQLTCRGNRVGGDANYYRAEALHGAGHAIRVIIAEVLQPLYIREKKQAV